MGKRHNQKAIFNLLDGTEIGVGGTGEPILKENLPLLSRRVRRNMTKMIKRISTVIELSGGDRPSISLENRFKTASVTFDGIRKEFTKTVVQQISINQEMYQRLATDVKLGDQIEATIQVRDHLSDLIGYRIGKGTA